MKMARLKDICDVTMGQAPPGSSYNTQNHGLPLVAGAGDLGPLNPIPKNYTTTPTRVSSIGDIILCIRATIGDVNWSDREYCLGRGVAGLSPYEDVLDPHYFWYWLQASKKVLAREARGSTFKQVSRDAVESMLIPLFPLPEQRRIAAILDKADAIRRKREEAIRLMEEFLRSAFLEMFGDPVTNPKGWPVKKSGQLLNFLTSGSRGWAKYYSQQGSIFFRIQNVGRNQLLMNDLAYVNPPDSAEARRTRIQTDDVLLSITADLGRTGVVPPGLGPAYINQHLAILRVNDIEPIYLSAFLAGAGGQQQFKVMNREGVKAGLNFDNIQSVKVIVPPKHLQRRFVELYHQQGSAMGTLSNMVEESSRLFNSLVQRAFRGEL